MWVGGWEVGRRAGAWAGAWGVEVQGMGWKGCWERCTCACEMLCCAVHCAMMRCASLCCAMLRSVVPRAPHVVHRRRVHS